jgi:ribose-phosphate pyrophosphokinase
MNDKAQDLMLLAGRANPPLALAIAEEIRVPLGKLEITNFSDGEIQVQIKENIRGEDVFIIQPTHAPGDNLLELLLTLDACRRASARRVTAVIPYFGYARQDRKDRPRVTIAAKLAANVITAAGADRVVTMDLHSGQIQGFFDIPMDHLYSSPVLVQHILSKHESNLVVVAPDVGGVKVARAYAKRLACGLAIVDKRRPQPNMSEVLHVIGEVEGKNVVIVDDMIDTAGTITQAAQALRNKGARDIDVVATHGIFSGPAIERIESAPIREVIVTDTVVFRGGGSSKIKMVSIAHVLAQAIMCIHNEESVSSLFEL